MEKRKEIYMNFQAICARAYSSCTSFYLTASVMLIFDVCSSYLQSYEALSNCS